MKVWIVQRVGEDVEGVFGSPEAARAFIDAERRAGRDDWHHLDFCSEGEEIKTGPDVAEVDPADGGQILRKLLLGADYVSLSRDSWRDPTLLVDGGTSLTDDEATLCERIIEDRER